MSKTFTDFSQRQLSLTAGLIFLMVGIYEMLVTKNYINGVKFLFSGSLLIILYLSIKTRLVGRKKKEFNAGYGLIIVGAYIKVLGVFAGYIIWIAGIVLLIRSVIEKKDINE
ncbi:MAG: hypothetical protein U9N10_07945 [Bacillota bacterium]|nr:hypothetical protein [Bacillota bacterium]